jgi:hypothetical protein
MSKFLSQTRKGPVASPFKIVLYGLEGVGKSTFAAEAPRPIFMDVEGGTDDLDVERLPAVATFEEALAAIDELTTEEHSYQTFVLDTADWMESLIWKHVCEANGVKSIEDVGYGKGFTAALEQWRTLLARLDALREKRSMHIIVLAHSHIRGFRNPTGDDYERYELKLNAKAAGIVKEWPSAVLFARYATYTHTDKNKRTRAVGDGSRIVSTEPRPAWDAKNRYGLPEEMPLSWAEFEACARARRPVDVDDVNASIAELLERADPKVRVQAEGALKVANGDAVKLAKLVDWLRGKVSKAA